jgi:hypothetical protein
MTRTASENVFARTTDYDHLPSIVATFATCDPKGRQHGHRAAIVRVSYEADPASNMGVPAAWIGTKFHVTPQAMRGGKDFGATPCQSRRVFDTLAEAQAYGEAAIAKARKARG